MTAVRKLPDPFLRELHESRRNPRITYFLYLHCRRLLDDLAAAIAALPDPVGDVLDVFCGTRPYEDLFSPGTRYVGFDIDDSYGPGRADVISTDFLPFGDQSFDVVLCTQAFYYLEDPIQGAAEILRVLRPGGTALISTTVVWPYRRDIVEHRFTGPELAGLFSGCDEVTIVENGGRGTSWATVTNHLIRFAESAASKRMPVSPRPLFAALYALVNAIGIALDRLERSQLQGVERALPQNILLSARKPR